MVEDVWKEKIKLIDKALLKEIHTTKPLNDLLQEAMEYSLMAGGKRLRPILLMAAADAAGGHGQDYITEACAIEMIHTYSLIHDDLPAMDNDDYRRGKPTNHKIFGDGMALLAGDALLTKAFEVILRQSDTSPKITLDIMKEVSQAAGSEGMVGGQAIDLQAEGKKINLETLRKMHTGKTGALFRASVRVGAILAGANQTILAALTSYADNFGLAFQITDDILDFTGDVRLLGKPVGSDEKNNKSTYVTLFSLEEARGMARKSVEKALYSLEILGTEADFLRQIVKYLLSRDK